MNIPWMALTRAAAWSLPIVLILSLWISAKGAKLYAQMVINASTIVSSSHAAYAWPVCLLFLGLCAVVDSFPGRYLLAMAGMGVLILRGRYRSNDTEMPPTPSEKMQETMPDWLSYLLIAGMVIAAATLVTSVNRSDFDDAEYIQQALQTLRFPEKAPYTFDMSLGTMLDQFRFAPYRVTSYETFVALLTHWTGLNVLTVYYLLIPGMSAGLSVLVAIAFARIFLPLRWALGAALLFFLVMLAWGETHVAYGNRVYVRLFQGKGLLIAITTPLSIVAALLYMRARTWTAWLALLMSQIAAVGVSSSGIVITIFATSVALLAGFLVQFSARALVTAIFGGFTLLYPIGIGLWVKYASSAANKVESIGTDLPIDASLGGNWREALALTILIASVSLISRRALKPGNEGGLDNRRDSYCIYVCLLLAFLALIFNPWLSEPLSSITSKNMHWRLAWAAPIPLLIAVGSAYLLRAGFAGSRFRLYNASGSLSLALIIAFLAIAPWSLARSNNVRWSFLSHNLPPEYRQAVFLAEKIRRETSNRSGNTVLVEPRVGTWLTVVAPELKLVMPGHGYPITLQTIMKPDEFQERMKLIEGVVSRRTDDPSLSELLLKYDVNVVATKVDSQSQAAGYRIQVLR